MICLSPSEIDALISEDLPYGDLTSRTLGFAGSCGTVRFAARSAMTVCGTEEAKLIFERLGAVATILAPTGAAVIDGAPLIEARGSATALFAAWKISQTLVEWCSGMASAVSDMVAAARAVAPRTVVACTRKSVPFTRRLAAKAVHAGGGAMHRVGLSDSVLLFPEHRLFASAAVPLAARPVIAVAGGIDAVKAARYAAAGADVIVTSWPYYASPRDVQVRFSSTEFEQNAVAPARVFP